MPQMYTYGTGSTIQSIRWSEIHDLLNQLPNNNTNSILAKDVRDAVFTLWEKVDEALNGTYINPAPTPVTVGGIPAGSTFEVPHTYQQMFDKLLYPYQSPLASLSGASNKEYGSSLNVTLSWSVTRRTNPITSITVDGTSVTPTGNNQSGTKATTATHSTTPPVTSTSSYSMSVGDGTQTTTANTSFTWMNRIYWGAINLSSIGNPDFGMTPGALANVSISSSTILALDGAGVSPGSQLASSKSKTYTNINGAGNHLIFAWPSNMSGTPTFTVNGLQNTAFSRVKNGWSFTNSFGFTTQYEVWISNTRQNSPLNIIIS